MATYMSAILCLMAWKEAICRPNAKRPSAYSRAMSSAACAPPSCSKATSTAARSSRRSTRGQPAPGAPSGSAAAPSNTIRAWERVGSTVLTDVRVTPGPVSSTRKRPARSRTASPATTMAKSATSPSVTGIFVPLTRPPSARVAILPGVATCAPSASAKQPMACPCAMRGSQRFFWAGLPASRRASVAR